MFLYNFHKLFIFLFFPYIHVKIIKTRCICFCLKLMIKFYLKNHVSNKKGYIFDKKNI